VHLRPDCGSVTSSCRAPASSKHRPHAIPPPKGVFSTVFCHFLLAFRRSKKWMEPKVRSMEAPFHELLSFSLSRPLSFGITQKLIHKNDEKLKQTPPKFSCARALTAWSGRRALSRPHLPKLPFRPRTHCPDRGWTVMSSTCHILIHAAPRARYFSIPHLHHLSTLPQPALAADASSSCHR
jgi:hypothetical protein